MNRHLYVRVLSAEGAVVLGVLGDFHLLDDLTESSTIASSVFTANSDLLSVVTLHNKINKSWMILGSAHHIVVS